MKNPIHDTQALSFLTFLKKLYHFLGGITFAIILIATTALFVIAGTLLESLYESHLYAAYFTYHNPFFFLLLGGFFLNILISALRRWPFQMRHIPFLITHLGLLMILGGTFVKNWYGTQGSMVILEGSVGDELTLANTFALKIDQLDRNNPQKVLSRQIAISPNQKEILSGILDSALGLNKDLSLTIMESVPHSSEKLELWIKGNHVVIAGMAPFPLVDTLQFTESTPLPPGIKFHPFEVQDREQNDFWDFFAVRASDVTVLAKQFYLAGLTLSLTDQETGKMIAQFPLKKVLDQSTLFSEGEIQGTLHFNYSLIEGFDQPQLILKYTWKGVQGEIVIALEGTEALLNKNLRTPYLGSAPLAADLERIPAIVLIQDLQGDEFHFAFGSHGQVDVESFRSDNNYPLYSLDNGFSGYSVQSHLSPASLLFSKTDHEQAQLFYLEKQLREAMAFREQLAPPLQLLNQACEKQQVDFATTCVRFLDAWNRSHSWLYPSQRELPEELRQVFQQLDWNTMPVQIKKSVQLSDLLFTSLEKELQQGKPLFEALEEHQWPLMASLRAERYARTIPQQGMEKEKEFYQLQQQIGAVSEQLPGLEFELPADPLQQARLFSAYLRLFGIHLQHLVWPVESLVESQERLKTYFFEKDPSKFAKLYEHPLGLETRVTARHQALPPSKKIEQNLPGISLYVQQGEDKELISLSYDRFAAGLKWPILGGQYLVRFQPLTEKIPYSVRLRDARQVNYPNSHQAYSYEADLVVTDLRDHTSVEKTVSMNHVHETWDGYRFYLANIDPPLEVASQRAQILVNHDPAKYWLTYPGAILVSLGIILLFWSAVLVKKIRGS